MTISMVTDNIKKVLIPEAPALVADYYNDERPFAGAMFETLGTNDANQIGIDDLLASTLLDVKVTPPGVRRVLGTDAADLRRAYPRFRSISLCGRRTMRSWTR